MALTRILSTEEVRKAIDQDSNYPLHELEDLADEATSFISTRTGYSKWGEERISSPKNARSYMYAKNIMVRTVITLNTIILMESLPISMI